jgi:dienelactone hydrolase
MRVASRWLKSLGIMLLMIAAALVLLAVVTPQGRAAAKTAGLVLQVVPNFPVKPLPLFTGEPERTPITYPSGVGEIEADVYRISDGKPRAAVVLFLGVNPAGRDEERVVNLGEALARSGFVVLVPWSANMVSRRVDPADVDLLVGAFEYLQAKPYVDPDRIGGGGFCVGSSMLLLAAADERIRDDVAFVNFFSGYYDASDFLVQFAASESFYAGARETWEPDSLTASVFTRLLIDGVTDPVERDALEAHFVDDGAMHEATREVMSTEADAVYQLLSGPTFEEARALVEWLPVSVREAMQALSPRNVIDDVSARLLIMHDREDALAPVEESRRLRDAVAGRDDTRYTEFSFFSHVDPGERVGTLTLLGESFRLFRHLYSIVRVAS